MKKDKGKAKGAAKEAGNTGRGQVVKLRPAKPKVSWLSRLPSPTQYWVSARDFVKEAIQELKKVTWPDKRETLGTTADRRENPSDHGAGGQPEERRAEGGPKLWGHRSIHGRTRFLNDCSYDPEL